MNYKDALIEPRGLHFGTSQSPSKYQTCNRVITNLLNKWGYRSLLYIDDRLLVSSDQFDAKGGQTNIGNVFLLNLKKI